MKNIILKGCHVNSSSGENSCQIDNDQFGHVKVLSMHNWIQKIYESFSPNFLNFSFPTEPKHVVILGVREASIVNRATTTDSREVSPSDNVELTAPQGGRQKDRGELKEGRRKEKHRTVDSTTRYDDTLFFVWTDSTPNKNVHIRIFACSIDPGAKESNDEAKGTPYLLEGKLYYVTPGDHNDGTNIYEAGHIFSTTEGHIQLLRDACNKYRIVDDLESALIQKHQVEVEIKGKTKVELRQKQYEFCSLEDNASIHMHHGYGNRKNSAFVGEVSTGCTVLAYSAESAAYDKFIEIINDAKNKEKKIPFLIVSSQYIRTYHEWFKNYPNLDVIDKAKIHSIIQTPFASVFNIISKYFPFASGLSHGIYIPSIISAKFVLEVVDFIFELLSISQVQTQYELHSLKFKYISRVALAEDSGRIATTTFIKTLVTILNKGTKLTSEKFAELQNESKELSANLLFSLIKVLIIL